MSLKVDMHVRVAVRDALERAQAERQQLSIECGLREAALSHAQADLARAEARVKSLGQFLMDNQPESTT